jgi:hypothetical protein
VFCNVTSCIREHVLRRFGETCCLQDSQGGIMETKRMKTKTTGSHEECVCTSTRIQGATPPKIGVFTAIGVKTKIPAGRDCTPLCLKACSSSLLDGTGPQFHCSVTDSPPLPSLGSDGNTNGTTLTATLVGHEKQIAWFCSRHIRPRLI